ncbi:hypothetical protein D3C86_2264800 [compost metagenome]
MMRSNSTEVLSPWAAMCNKGRICPLNSSPRVKGLTKGPASLAFTVWKMKNG